MSRGATRSLILTFLCLAICFLFVPSASAALVTIGPAQCAVLNGAGADIKISPSVATAGHNMHVDATDDVVVACLLDAGTVTIEAHSITVDKTGVNTGSIHTTAKAPSIVLRAGTLNNGHDKCTDPVAANALASQINILAGVLQDDNGNGTIVLTACGDINFTPGSAVTSKAGQINGTCLFPDDPSVTPWCKMTAVGTSFFGNRIFLESEGDMTLTNDTVTTQSPRDRQSFISDFGSLLAGSNCPQELPPGTCIPIDQACLFCQECHNHNGFFGGKESRLFAFGEQEVDFGQACIEISEDITITADGRLPVSPYALTGGGVGPGGIYYINLENAEIRDDIFNGSTSDGKTGVINITAIPPLTKSGTPVLPGDVPLVPPGAGHGCSPSWFGTGSIWYDLAVLIDNGKAGGGTDTQAVSFMNGCRTAIAGNCGLVVLHCDPTPIPSFGFIADPVGRASTFVFGVARCDS